MYKADLNDVVARRFRVLIVDDQREVAKTLSGLLPRDMTECRFANNGEEGLARLLNEIFDLVVVDLRMPPGKWGGLWLLQELTDRGLSVDALVLSGEAAQSETIDAMRLGALDFVIKENAAAELADRVMDVLSRGQATRSAYASVALPAPIALPYQRIRVTRGYEGKLLASLMTAEAVFRFCALAAIAVVRSRGKLERSPFSRLARPSPGDWRDLCQNLQAEVGDHPVARWIRVVCSYEAEAIVRYRNETVHGGGVPAVGVKRALREVLSWLDFFVSAVRSGAPVDLVVAGSMTSTGDTFEVEWARLTGAARSVEWIHKDISTAPVTNRVYMRSTADNYVDMSPLILANTNPDGPSGDWSVAVMEGVRTVRRGEMTDSDRLRYVDTATGVRSTSSTETIGGIFRRNNSSALAVNLPDVDCNSGPIFIPPGSALHALYLSMASEAVTFRRSPLSAEYGCGFWQAVAGNPVVGVRTEPS